MNIIFPELDNPIIKQAIEEYNSEPSSIKITPIKATDLEEACSLVALPENSALITGIDYTTRDVVLSCKNFLGIEKGTKTFSSCFVMQNNQARKDPNFSIKRIVQIRVPRFML